jgi:TfoX/Sxy family transcriptional regulator of competence genes
MPKPTDDDLARFRGLVPDEAGVEVKPMFGQLGAFVNGNMFMGLFGGDIGVKLGETEQAELLAKPGSGPFGPAERPMGGWATIPADWAPDAARPWVESALAHIATLPPKKPKGAKKTP